VAQQVAKHRLPLALTSGRPRILMYFSHSGVLPTQSPQRGRGSQTQGPKHNNKVCSPAQRGEHSTFLTQQVPKHRSPLVLTLGDLESSIFFSQRCTSNPKVLKTVAGRRRKDRNIVIRFVAPRKGANEVLRDPTRAYTQCAILMTFGGLEFCVLFSQRCSSNPQSSIKSRAADSRTETS
jgi:hypothetical protein